MSVEFDPETRTITASDYRLRVLPDDPVASLDDREGRPWSRLSLLASLDRTDCADESFAIEPARVTPTTVGNQDAIDVEVAASSEAWIEKRVRLRCFADRLELTATVRGAGTLATGSVFGGRGVLRTGACGSFYSSIEFASLFVPTPTEPVYVVRPAATPAALGIVGDAAPGRLHAVFSPPPLAFGFGRASAGHGVDVPTGDWLTASVAAAISELTFTELRYAPVDGGFRLEFDYDGHTVVDGEFTTPPIVLRTATDPWSGLTRYRADLAERGFVPNASTNSRPQWWREPIFCGWGAQCARAAIEGVAGAAELARQAEYDDWLQRLADHGITSGTIVIDDRWQTSYGNPEPDRAHWPDLRGWIAQRHAAGQRVLLWWKAWDASGLPADECIFDPSGTPVAADPGSPAYRAHVARIVADLLGPDGVDADGFKIDFTQRGPAGQLLQRPNADADAPWGVAAVHQLLATIYTAAKAAKPDALLVTHTVHPAFADVSDMIRLNDLLESDATGARVAPVDQLHFRHAVATAVLPEHLIDTDQWPIGNREQWRAYVQAQAHLGVPALYYAERIDGSGEELTDDDFALVAQTWAYYRS